MNFPEIYYENGAHVHNKTQFIYSIDWTNRHEISADWKVWRCVYILSVSHASIQTQLKYKENIILNICRDLTVQ